MKPVGNDGWERLSDKKRQLVYKKCAFCQNEAILKCGYEEMGRLNMHIASEGYMDDYLTLQDYESGLVSGGNNDDQTR